MKTITLLAAAVLMVTNAANASEIINYRGAGTTTTFRFDEPISFNERGIEFYVFPSGEFDFNTEASTGAGTYYRHGRRPAINATYGAPGTANGGVRIEHDSQGRVRRIGNVFVNYDSANRIKRIGSVYMSYNNFGLAQIGGMRIVYERRGNIVNIIGDVKGYSQSYAYNNNNSYNYNSDYNYSSGNTNNNENDYYYYRPDGTKAKIEDVKKVEIKRN